LFTGFPDFRSDLTDFRDFKRFQGIEDIKYPNGSRPDFKAFSPGVRDSSDVKSGLMDFRPHFPDYRSDVKSFRRIFLKFHV